MSTFHGKQWCSRNERTAADMHAQCKPQFDSLARVTFSRGYRRGKGMPAFVHVSATVIARCDEVPGLSISERRSAWAAITSRNKRGMDRSPTCMLGVPRTACPSSSIFRTHSRSPPPNVHNICSLRVMISGHICNRKERLIPRPLCTLRSSLLFFRKPVVFRNSFSPHPYVFLLHIYIHIRGKYAPPKPSTAVYVARIAPKPYTPRLRYRRNVNLRHYGR